MFEFEEGEREKAVEAEQTPRAAVRFSGAFTRVYYHSTNRFDNSTPRYQ